ncbi:hypothetical protein BDA99DRAFT_565032 [Phascolomyces articulosus]|uniref:Uncharacterized protein n=1 Tax=Phascolomyces articulosus TaxID=60185 RepID=A0AAD5P8U4_9FUNG|nr:hypothetical protein BDA99DRAFT_565032 [Phascolomyces articulosus]
MDWDRFKKALANQNTNDNRQRLCLLVQESPFILEFLDNLYIALCRCQTPDQCSALYPEAELTLTKASASFIHPLIAAHPEIAKRLVACLLEYAKFEQSDREQSLQAQSSSIQWCITRLRRLTHATIVTTNEPERKRIKKNGNHIEQQLERLLNELEDRIVADTLHSEKLRQLLDMSLVLVYQDKANLIIEKLVACAIELLEKELAFLYRGMEYPSLPSNRIDHNNTHNTTNQDEDDEEIIDQVRSVKQPISQSFLETLLQHRHGHERRGKSQLWFLYKKWPWHLKTGLWRFYGEILEADVVDATNSIALESKYISSDDIRSKLNDSSLIQTMLINICHFRTVYMVISEYLLTKGDWRIFRFLFHVFDSTIQINNLEVKHHIHRLSPELLSAMNIIESNHDQKMYLELQAVLHQYIYAGDMEGMKNRRCHAWLLPLMYPRFIYQCISVITKWCSNKSEQWNHNVDAAWKMIGWLICPSDDDRLNMFLDRVRQWILALKGFCDNDAISVIQLFSPEWHDTFNGNIPIALITSLSTLSHLVHWCNEDYLSLLDAILHFTAPSQQQQPINDTELPFTAPYNPSIIYLFNDYLPLWESLLNPAVAFDDEYSVFNDYSLSNKLRQITVHSHDE